MIAADRILRLEDDADLSPIKGQAEVGFELVGIDLTAALFDRKDANALPAPRARIGERRARAAE